MKILLLSDPTSAHIIKWARSLAENGLELYIFGFSKHDQSFYQNYEDIQIDTLGLDRSFVRSEQGSISKLRYVIKALPKVRKIINDFEPDLVHAHYATTYGLIGALSGFHPYVLSVWGTDIFDFPNKSFVHKALVRYNLKKSG